MLFDGQRVKRIRGLPCRNGVGDFVTLGNRLEKKEGGKKNWNLNPKNVQEERKYETKRKRYKSVVRNETAPPPRQQTVK